jgi:hypothetical protein
MNDSPAIPGIIYILTNPAMPGIVKIGKTSREIETRLSELYSTGVPVPFECVFAGKVSDIDKVEKAFHLAFAPYRINPKREFFHIEAEQAIAMLELMTTEDVTPAMQKEADEVDIESKEASRKLKARRPSYNFLEMGIPIGSILNFTQLPQESVEVANERRVSFKGEIISLTAVTKELLNVNYRIAPGPYWTYQGKVLKDIYNETYEMN